MRVLRWLGTLLGLAIIGVLGTAVVARLSDGPLGPFPGGRLRAGELVKQADIDFSFAADAREMELQLVLPRRSRTVWPLVDGGELYVLSAFMDVPFWKKWPHELEKDARCIARLNGKRYVLRAARVRDPRVHARLMAQAEQKYGLQPETPPTPDDVWLFRLLPVDDKDADAAEAPSVD
jgi:hypothetical protein